jgi:uroporphyrinogen-III decarboxylase
MTICGNINPVTILQDGTDEEVEAEIETQIRGGKKARGFVLSTGNPVTPSTPVSRVRRFVERGGEIGGRICSEENR